MRFMILDQSQPGQFYFFLFNRAVVAMAIRSKLTSFNTRPNLSNPASAIFIPPKVNCFTSA